MLKLEEMTPEQKLGKVLCFRRFDDQDDIDFTLEMIKKGACGAVQINFNSRTEELIRLMRSAADYPLLVVADMERGVPLTNIPPTSLTTLAAANNPEYVRAFAAHTASEAKKLGYSGCWGPVIDVMRTDGYGQCSLGRSSGDTPEGVLNIVEEISRTFASYNFHSTGKHYPGGKDMLLDTHMFGAFSGVTEEQLVNFDLVPYFELMKKGLLPAVMTGHTTFKKIDPEYPASMSKKVIDIIRKRGFDGVIYTDSFAMMAILQTFGEKKAYSTALMAGNDIILPNYRTPTREVYEMMLDEYRNGAITDEALDNAVRRIMKLEEYCSRTPLDPVPAPDNIVELMRLAAKDSVTAECDEGVPAALENPEKKRLFIAVISQSDNTDAVGAEISMKVTYKANVIRDAINKNFPNSDVIFTTEFPSPHDNERVLSAASHYDEVVCVTYCTSDAYMGTDSLTKRIEAVMNALILSGKVTALVHFGNPFALDNLYHVPRVILMYNAAATIPYAFEILAGKYEPKGKYPLARKIKSATPYGN